MIRGDSKGNYTVDWSQALRHPRLAVIGLPGSGKTTLLQFTAVRLAEILARDDDALLADLGLEKQTNKPPVPLLLPLREFGAFLDECSKTRLMGANPRLLLECFASYYRRFDLTLPPDFFSQLCDAGRAMVLLDGLDEVTRNEDRIFVSSVVREFVLRYPRCRYVISSRVAAYQGDARIEADFRICTVSDLSTDQQERFIKNWSRSLHRLVFEMQGEQLEREAGRYANDLWTSLQPNDRVRGLARNPLLLTVVAVIFWNKCQLPEDRASLYEECVEVLLRGGRGKADHPGLKRAQLAMGLNQRREVLASVAYTMHQQGEDSLSVNRQELLHMVRAYLNLRGEGEETANLFVDELPIHIGLLDEQEPDRYRFSHLSFQEFLAARHVAETDRWDELLERYQESWWREVILLCAGHLSSARCWKFLEKLLDVGIGRETIAYSEALELATDALGELEKFKGEGPLKERIGANALRLIEHTGKDISAAARVRCGRVLARVGDPRPGVCDLPPAMVRIEGGMFVIGSTREQAEEAGKAYEQYYLDSGNKKTAKKARTWPEDEINDQPVTVATFEISRYLTTNTQYELFINDGGYDIDALWWDAAGRAWLQRNDVATEGLKEWQMRQYKNHPEFWLVEQVGRSSPNYPVVGISWYEAVAYCRWLTQKMNDRYIYRLPTEAEWEYAARRDTRRVYPWGNEELDGERANYDRKYGMTTAVGCFPAGATPDGIFDVTGNVWEWTGSIYKPYPYDPNDGREDISNPANSTLVLRGGGWCRLSDNLRASDRRNNTPVFHNYFIGFRLARHLP